MSADEPTKIPLIEIFGPTIQGEGAMIGVQTMFVRTGGCDYNCAMCDSRHAIDSEEIQKRATYLTAVEIADQLIGDWPDNVRWVTLSGGNPCLWDLEKFVDNVHRLGPKRKLVALECQGTYYKSWVSKCDQITISPKGPGMGNSNTDMEEVKQFIETCIRFLTLTTGLCLKVVCFGQKDVEFADWLAGLFPTVDMYLSVGNTFLPGCEEPYDEQVQELLEFYRLLVQDVRRFPRLIDTRVLPQLHVLAYGNEERH